MRQYTTNTARSARRAPGNGLEPKTGHIRPAPRRCEACGASLEGRRRQTRYCSPTCRARAYDARTGRTSHN